MKFLTKKSMIQKILVAILLLLFMNFTIVPYYSYAGFIEAGMSTLAKEILQLVAWFGDVIMSALNNFMLGADGFGSSMLDKGDPNLDNENSWLYVKEKKEHVITFEEEDVDTKMFDVGEEKYSIPNMIYSPENIFANRIAALDVNFLRENEYQSIYAGGKSEFKDKAEKGSESAARGLRDIIASWYKSFRNIAIVGLLTVLVYLGIRILISSTAADKAKYKENLRDWIVALCLVFFIHFIMSAILMVTDKCTELFGDSAAEGYTVVINGGKSFNTNLTGLIRFSAQSTSLGKTATYTVIYIALVIYTCIFTFLYFKRFLYMAFFTMIAPLVALTYPIDKVGDGKAQAFNMWFKEYTMNAIIQPIHLILYTVFVGAAYDLAAKNPIYALVAIGFLIPAEKFIKKMFGLDKADSEGGFGSFAGGALTMTGLQKLSQLGSGGKDKGKGGKEETNDKSGKGIFMPPNSVGGLEGFSAGSQEDPSNVRQTEQENNPEDMTPITQQNEQQPEMPSAEEIRQMEQQLASYDETDPYFMDPEHQQLQERYQDLREQQQNAQNTQQQEQEVNESPIQTMPAQRRNAGEKPRPIKGYAGRVVGRGAKAAVKQLWKHKGGIAKAGMKAVLKPIGLTAGATIGLAAGIATGDVSKSISFMGAGAMAGNTIANNTVRGASNLATGLTTGVKDGVRGTIHAKRTAQQAINEEKYGYTYAREVRRQQENKTARKQFLKDEDQQRQYKELAATMGYTGDVKNLMKAAADYKEAGITDDKLIQNSLQAEYGRTRSINGSNHDKYVQMASFAHENGFDRSNITDTKKREQLDNVLDTTVVGDERAKRQAALMYADIFDARNTYEKFGKFGTSNLQRERNTNGS